MRLRISDCGFRIEKQRIANRARACLQSAILNPQSAISLLLASAAHAQSIPPFIGGPVTAFDTEIRVVDSGALLDATAVVSQDRRYVTITAQPSNTSLLALQQYRTQTISQLGSGYVGGVDPTGAMRAIDGHSPTAIADTAKNNASVLNRRGVYLLLPLK